MRLQAFRRRIRRERIMCIIQGHFEARGEVLSKRGKDIDVPRVKELYANRGQMRNIAEMRTRPGLDELQERVCGKYPDVLKNYASELRR
jgi:hypothetical protein